jgi:hypothetical protein
VIGRISPSAHNARNSDICHCLLTLMLMVAGTLARNTNCKDTKKRNRPSKITEKVEKHEFP